MSSAGGAFKNWSPETLAKGHKEPAEKGERSRKAVAEEAGGALDEQELLFRSSEEVRKIEAEAHTAGYEDGYAEGLARARADMEPLREAWLSWASQIPMFEANRLKALLPELAGLLTEALRRILGEERKKPKTFQGLLERMVKEYATGREAELRVSEEEYRLVIRQDKVFADDLASRGVRLTVGPDLSPGQVELRFPDRIVSFDPESAVESFQKTIVRTAPGSPLDEPPIRHEDINNDDRA